MEMKTPKMPWAVVIDRPYYPRIDVGYGSEQYAVDAARKLATEEVSEDGKYESKVYVVEIKSVIDIATDY